MPEDDIQTQFQYGRVFKRTELHDLYGGQRQGGIVTPAGRSLIFAISGKSGRQHGYKDHWLADGTFCYYGEGQTGDMRFVGGNKAIRDHAANGKHLIVFEQLESQKTHLRCLGEFECVGSDFEAGQDRTGNVRQAIVFRLRPKGTTPNIEQLNGALEADVASSEAKTTEQLQQGAFGGGPAQQATATSTVRVRNPDVIAYVLRRAEGVCEGCRSTAPFVKPNGQPYLEVHHVVPLADDGADSADNAVALCPNCHRRCHHAKDKKTLTRKLKRSLGASAA